MERDTIEAMIQCLKMFLYTPNLINEVYNGSPRKHGKGVWNEAVFNDTVALMVQCIEDANR